AAQNLQLAANALGYGSIWLTGPFATDEHVRQSLGLGSDDRIAGFIYLGTPGPAAAMARKKLQNRPQPADFMVNWTGQHDFWMRRLITPLLIALGLCGPVPAGAETYVYQEKDGTRWISDRALDPARFTFIQKYGRATATRSCHGVTPEALEQRAQRYMPAVIK